MTGSLLDAAGHFPDTGFVLALGCDIGKMATSEKNLEKQIPLRPGFH
jgi:hypothetical protein